MRDFIKTFLQDKTKICPKRLNKKIKELFISSCPPKINGQFPYSKTSFDVEGNVIEYQKFQQGKIVQWEKFLYENGMLRETMTGRSKQGNGGSYNANNFDFFSIPTKLENDPGILEINENGEKVVSTFFLSGELQSRRVFNERGLCTEFTEYSKNTSITNKEKYDSLGQLLEARRYKSDGTALNYTINTYDQDSRLTRSVSVSRTGHLTHDVVLKYNNDGMLVETIEHPANPENAFADIKDASGGYSHKYFYLDGNLLDTDMLYLCGEHIMSYKHIYQFW